MHATADRCFLIFYYHLPLFLPLHFPRLQVIRRETRQQVMLSNLLKPQEFQRFSRHFMTPCGTGEDVLKCCRTNYNLDMRLAKGTPCEMLYFFCSLRWVNEIIFPATTVEGCLTHIAPLKGFSQSDFTFFPSFDNLWKILRCLLHRSSHVYATGFRCCNTFCLPFSNVVPLVVGGE